MQLDLTSLGALAAGDSQTLYDQRSGFASDSVTVLAVETASGRILIASPQTGAGLSVLAETAGIFHQLSQMQDGPTTHLAAVSALTHTKIGNADYVFAASATEHGVSAFRLSADGELHEVDTLGAGGWLPINRPTALDIVDVGGSSYLVVASQGSGSLTSLRIEADGILTPVDQVVDDLATRFGGAVAMDWIVLEGQAFGAVAGSDGGVTLMRLLPDGGFHVEAVLIDEADTALTGVTQLAFVDTANGVQLIALGAGERGLTQIALDLPELGMTRIGSDASRDGGDADDVLVARDGGDVIYAGDGDDIIVDGSGRDDLTGGGGADIFVFRDDGEFDTVRDFDPAVDQVDLSRYSQLYHVSQIGYETNATGIRLVIGDEKIRLIHVDRTPMTAEDVAHALIFNADRSALTTVTPTVIVGSGGNDSMIGTSRPDEISAGDGNDFIEWSHGADLLDGGMGVDHVSYDGADVGVALNLAQQAANGGSAAGDRLISIEIVTGTDHADTMTGDADANELRGGNGDDRLLGGGGADTLQGGLGNDWLDGGEGIDTADYSGDGAVQADLMMPDQNGGAASGDVYRGIEGLRGSVLADDLRGDAADNLLIGGQGNDFLMGRDGADTLIGSHGHDILSGGNGGDILNGGRGNDRLIGGGGADRLVGEDGDDTLIGTEGSNSLVGGAGADVIYDGGGSSTLSGGTGRDRLIGNAGHDRLFGGDDADILNGGNGNDRLSGEAGADYLLGGGGWDIFVFYDDMGRDQIEDFVLGEDRLFLSANLVGTGIAGSAVVDAHATILDGSAVLDFGNGNSVTLLGLTDLTGLEAAILIVA
ncbi:MAG: hypothetical protein ABNH26_02975 [Celeribacter sp.]|jgi:Ca2+-binding RTX toxin-like protein